jgi:glucose-1-phosphate adenylyltransferase
MRHRVLGMILAGGKGSRLSPLTDYRSKPAVPFGGIYRIIDFVLSNFVNSEIRSIYVLTQFKSQSLAEHIHRAWAGTNLRPGNFIMPVPAQMQTAGAVWYEGTADAIYQNLNLVRESSPHQVCVFGGDHIYFMDVSQMLRLHVRMEADVTIAAIPVPAADASRFGVIEADADGWVKGFHEKVADPPRRPGDPDRCYASMGNYVFTREVLDEELVVDATDPQSSHDFGNDILPRMVAAGKRVLAYDFESNRVPGHPDEPNVYWRDVGTIEAYYEANLDLKDPVPALDLYNRAWPINTLGSSAAPARFVSDGAGHESSVLRSMLGQGTVVIGATLRDCVVGRNVRVYGNATVEESILGDGVRIETDCRVRRAIIDKDVRLAAGTTVGFDEAADRERGWTRSETGITVIPKSPVIRTITTIDL